MLKKYNTAVVNNRGVIEVGKIVHTWMRKGVNYYNVQMEKGSKLDRLTTDQSMPCFINEELSQKYNNVKCSD